DDSDVEGTAGNESAPRRRTLSDYRADHSGAFQAELRGQRLDGPHPGRSRVERVIRSCTGDGLDHDLVDVVFGGDLTEAISDLGGGPDGPRVPHRFADATMAVRHDGFDVLTHEALGLELRPQPQLPHLVDVRLHQLPRLLPRRAHRSIDRDERARRVPVMGGFE